MAKKKELQATELAKQLDMTTIDEYFDYIIESILNGQRTQARELFEKMNVPDRKTFMNYSLYLTILPRDKEKILSFGITFL